SGGSRLQFRTWESDPPGPRKLIESVKLSAQLEIALKKGYLVPWEFDPATQTFSWHESRVEGNIFRQTALDEWILGVEPTDRPRIIDALASPANTDVEIEFGFNSVSGQRRIQATGR